MKPIPAALDSNADPAAPDLLDLETFLPYRLSVLSNRISNAIARVYARRFGLSIPVFFATTYGWVLWIVMPILVARADRLRRRRSRASPHRRRRLRRPKRIPA